MLQLVEKSTAKILNAGEKTVGTGFLVAPNLLVTCAHLVLDAYESDSKIVHVQFTGRAEKQEARIIEAYWSDPGKQDVAILRIDATPAGVSPLRLGLAKDCRPRNNLYTFGYARAAGEEGIAGLGTFVRFMPENNLIQFRMHEANHGHSGAPLYDERRRVVIGMIKKGNDEETRNAETTFAVSMEIIQSVCDQINPASTNILRRSALIDGIHLLPYDYAGRIQNFLNEYLGSLDRPEPFGGREEEFKFLDLWLRNDVQRLLLAAPAGRGKSALLVRWLEHLQERDNLEIAFVPISIRFRTNLASVFYACLAARLAALYGEDVPTDLETSTEVWQGLVAAYLNREPDHHKTVLVVIDGLDEAGDWEAGTDLTPIDLLPGIRVVVSARYLSGDVDEKTWLRRLGWEQDGLSSVLKLEPLSLSGVSDVLKSMGFPLDELSQRVDITSELYRLSQGDPLLIHLYVEDLWKRGKDAVRLQPEDLRSIKPGYEGYFDRWWDDQKKLWGKEAPLLKKQVQLVFDLLCGSLGGLTREDLKALDTKKILNTHSIEFAIDTLKRFIIGTSDERRETEVGYVLTHPKLRDYFWNRLTSREQEALETRFINWGDGVMRSLIREEINPSDVPCYLLNYYGAHLERSHAAVERFLPFIDYPYWYRAWFSYEGAYGGYLLDVKRVLTNCELFNRTELMKTGKAPLIVKEIRCAFIESSLHSLATNVKPELLVKLFASRIWTLSQTLVYIRQMSDTKQQRKSIFNLVPYIQSSQLYPFLATANALLNQLDHANVLVLLMRNFSDVADDALNAISELNDEKARSSLLESIIPYLPAEKLQRVVLEAQRIKDSGDYAALLTLVSDRYPEAIDEVISTLLQTANDELRITMLEWVLPRVKTNHLSRIEQGIRKVVDAHARNRLFIQLAEYSSNLGEDAAIELALDDIDDPKLLTRLSLILPAAQINRLIKVMLQKPYREGYLEALTILAGRIQWKKTRAISLLSRIDDEQIRTHLLANLIQIAPALELEDTLLEIRRSGDPFERAHLLVLLAIRDPRAVNEAWTAVLNLDTDARRIALFSALSAHFQLDEFVSQARETLTFKNVIELASLFPNAAFVSALSQFDTGSAGNKARGSSVSRPRPLPPLPKNKWKKALRDVIAKDDPEVGALIVAAIVQEFPRPFKQALVIMKQLEDEDLRTLLLIQLLHSLPDYFYDEDIVDAVRMIAGKENRAALMVALCLRSPDLYGEALAALDVLENWKPTHTTEKPDLRQLFQTSRTDQEALSLLGAELEEKILADDQATDATFIAMLKESQSIHDKIECTFFLSTLVTRNPQVTMEILERTRGKIRDDLRFPLVLALSKRLPAIHIKDFLVSNRWVRSEDELAVLLIDMSGRFPQIIDHIQQTTLIMKNEMLRARTLFGIMPLLPAKLMIEMLNMERGLFSGWSGAIILMALARNIPKYYLDRVHAKVQKFEDPWTKALLLGNLAHRLPKYKQDAFASFDGISDEVIRARIFSDLAQYIPEAALEAFRLNRHVESEYERALYLCGLARYLYKAAKEAAIAIHSLDDAPSRALLLCRLAQHMPKKADEALNALIGLPNENDRINGLSILMPCLENGQLTAYEENKILSLIAKIQDESRRTRLLGEVATWVPAAFEDAIYTACNTQDDQIRNEVLQTLSPGWQQMPVIQAYKIWTRTIGLLSKRTRSKLALDLQFFVEIAFRLGDESTANEIYDAIHDVENWWP